MRCKYIHLKRVEGLRTPCESIARGADDGIAWDKAPGYVGTFRGGLTKAASRHCRVQTKRLVDDAVQMGQRMKTLEVVDRSDYIKFLLQFRELGGVLG